ncbi:GGDEF domain-containing protein [Nocardioides sp.]|uniref:GGDEF domain-containing protein n=1 Tax=Nocardioides sp. TaxID=35761 RepID=UPI0026209743|nr:GGDEF domain-containing protein [Nocardioides sp.]
MDATTTELERFTESAESVVSYLRSHSCLTDWSVSRIDSVEQVHLHVSGGSLLEVGDRVPWEDTFCRQMLGGASQIVFDSQREAAYAALPASADVRSYAGFPIVEDDGSLFGTLCGLGAEPIRSADELDAELLGLLSTLLSSQLRLVRAAASHRHSAVLADAAANTDVLTGLLNRRGWDILAADVEARVAGLGEHGGVVMIDLDGLKTVNDTVGHHAGDVLLRRAGEVLREVTRPVDSVARLGGDEFAVYVDDVPSADLDAIVRRYAEALEAADVAGSIGAAAVVPVAGQGCVAHALAEADALMYVAKAERKRSAGRSGLA